MATLPTPTDRFVGATLAGRYRLLDLIGQGAAGRVYRAMQEPMGREVAVKIMHNLAGPEEAHDIEVRFLREAALAGRIQHPNVVTLHDFGRTSDGDCYIVMEHLRGRTLRSLMRDGHLPLPRALRIFEQLILGLRAVHKAGMVHRDIKPSNIILLRADDGGDFVKLFDFGLVKGDDEVTISQNGVFMGTPHYVSPEQARGLDADERADLYSAGVVLYRLLTGMLPFYADNPLAVAAMHIREPVPAMAHIAPDIEVPAPAEALVQRLLQKDPAQRPADADAVLAELTALRRALGLAEETSVLPAPVDPFPVQAPPGRRRGPLLMGLGLLVTVLGGGGLAWMSQRAPVALSPVALSPVALSPVELSPVVLEALQTAPVALSPVALSPVELSPVEAPLPREVVLLVSSEPGGAEVRWGDLLLGTTPLARGVTVLEGEGGPRRLSLSLKGHRSATVEVDFDQDHATGHAVLASLRAPDSAPAAPRSTRRVLVDEVLFSAEQADAALRWLNSADSASLRASGIAPRQANIILDGRPFESVQAFGDTPYIGTKTVQSVLDQVSAP